jgi:3-methyladenine DNA glycosylase AlkD
MSVHPWVLRLRERIGRHGNTEDAAAMAAYMKGIAPFFGVKAGPRRALLQEHIALHGEPPLEDLVAIARSCFACPERELHHCAVDLLMKRAKKLAPGDLPWVEELIAAKSWWDTVDALAVHVAGAILKRHPGEIEAWNERWIACDDLWLNRTAILFQLKWRQATDAALLFANIRRHAGHPDFFIRKAIGWALREYSATDPDAVRAFVGSAELSPLSAREALRKLD